MEASSGGVSISLLLCISLSSFCSGVGSSPPDNPNKGIEPGIIGILANANVLGNSYWEYKSDKTFLNILMTNKSASL